MLTLDAVLDGRAFVQQVEEDAGAGQRHVSLGRSLQLLWGVSTADSSSRTKPAWSTQYLAMFAAWGKVSVFFYVCFDVEGWSGAAG